MTEPKAISKRVAVMLVGGLDEAIRDQNPIVADSEPYWLKPDQYKERNGGIELFPELSLDLLRYATTHNLRPIGIVVIDECGNGSNYFNEACVPDESRPFAKHLLELHAQFWFQYLPWVTRNGRA